jgi:hypothetical protein
MWRNRFGRGFGPVVRQNTEWMTESRRHYYPEIVRVIIFNRNSFRNTGRSGQTDRFYELYCTSRL